MSNGLDDRGRAKALDRIRSRSTSQVPAMSNNPDEVVLMAKSINERIQSFKTSLQGESNVVVHEQVAGILMQLRPLLNMDGPFSSPDLLGSIKRLVTLSKTVNAVRISDSDKKLTIEALELVSFAITACVSDFVMSKAEKASIELSRRRGGSKSKMNEMDKLRGLAEVGDMTSCLAGRSGMLLSSSKRIAEVREDESSTNSNEANADGDGDTTDMKGDTIDASVLMLLDFGVEIALERAKRWSIVTKAMQTYVEKQATYMTEYARQVNKLLINVRPIFAQETHSPLQQAFLTATDYDQEDCEGLLAAGASILKEKFLVPITETLNNFNKRRKQLKEIWYRQMKAMQDAINATEKAHSLYVAKRQQLTRIREQQQQVAALNESSSKPGGSNAPASSSSAAVDALTNFIGLNAASKADKKKKLEDEALHKLLDAEAAYKASVAAADRKHEEVLQLKLSVLKEIESMMLEADTALKLATLDYFHLRHDSVQIAPAKLERVADLASQYAPGSEFIEFLRTMKPVDVSPPVYRHEHCPKNRNNRQSVVSSTRVSSMHSSDSQSSDLHYSNEQISTVSMPTQEDVSDTESCDTEFGYAQAEAEESPIQAHRAGQSFAPKPKTSEGNVTKGNVVTSLFLRRKAIGGGEKTTTEDIAILECHKCGCQLTPISQQCGRCGASVADENRKPRRWFGVDLPTQISESGTGAKVPALLRMCLEDIEKENRGILMQGIYRISGVKSRVDKLAEEFDQCANAEELRKIDLLEQQPHTVANLFKLYLRQLPEPLLTTALYDAFVDIGKKFAADGDVNSAVEQLAELTKKLPVYHFESAWFLFSHLKRISERESANQMSASNLSIVFAPNVLHHAKSDDRYNITDMQYQTKVVELLIQHVDKIFIARA